MSKAILIANGPKFVALKARNALAQYFDEVCIIGHPFDTSYLYESHNQNLFNKYFLDIQQQEDIHQAFQGCDFVFGIEHSAAEYLCNLKNLFPKIIAGIQILDFPIHTFGIVKDFHSGQLERWQSAYIPFLKSADIILYNQMHAMQELSCLYPDSINAIIRYPNDPILFEQYERKNYIMFSGRTSPDKGVHYLIDALSTLNYKIPLKVIGNGQNEILSRYAAYLNVDFQAIGDCSESDKWKMYHECRFTVCGVDNPYIAGLSPLEGISVGRLGVVFDTPEHRFHYDRFAMYAIMKDIGSLARTIDAMYRNPKIADDHAKDGVEWCKENCSYEKWASDIYHIYRQKNEKN